MTLCTIFRDQDMYEPLLIVNWSVPLTGRSLGLPLSLPKMLSIKWINNPLSGDLGASWETEWSKVLSRGREFYREMGSHQKIGGWRWQGTCGQLLWPEGQRVLYVQRSSKSLHNSINGRPVHAKIDFFAGQSKRSHPSPVRRRCYPSPSFLLRTSARICHSSNFCPHFSHFDFSSFFFVVLRFSSFFSAAVSDPVLHLLRYNSVQTQLPAPSHLPPFPRIPLWRIVVLVPLLLHSRYRRWVFEVFFRHKIN